MVGVDWEVASPYTAKLTVHGPIFRHHNCSIFKYHGNNIHFIPASSISGALWTLRDLEKDTLYHPFSTPWVVGSTQSPGEKSFPFQNLCWCFPPKKKTCGHLFIFVPNRYIYILYYILYIYIYLHIHIKICSFIGIGDVHDIWFLKNDTGNYQT